VAARFDQRLRVGNFVVVEHAEAVAVWARREPLAAHTTARGGRVGKHLMQHVSSPP
jgi:hypothetical protein